MNTQELRRGSKMTGNLFDGGRICPLFAIDIYLPYRIYNQGITDPTTYLIILHPAILLALELAL